jgi:hypothetical protein
MTKLKTVNIKGKNYVEVHERLRYFRATYPNYCLTSEVLDKTDSSILIIAKVIGEDGRVLATGLAEEEKGTSYINKTSYVENCETSAWGRALGNFGIGLDTSVASADEVRNAVHTQDKSKAKPEYTQYVLNIGDENWTKVLKYISANKKLGLEQIVKNLSVKYKIKAQIKKEISNLIK